MNNKVFPIKNESACLFKWTWSTIFLNRGTTTSCHRGKHWTFDENTIMDFHNHPGKLEDRKKMLEGVWPGNGCEYCRDIEQAGGFSDRISQQTNIRDTPKELYHDETAIAVTPKILEIYFNNLCNQSCVYCSPGFSSQIEQEVKRYGPSKFNFDYSHWPSDSRDQYNVYLAKFWEWMEINHSDLTVFNILGGEPMYQKEFDMCLDFFDKHPSPDLVWNVFTNMNHAPEKFKEKIQKIQELVDANKIQKMRLTCSVDCWGEEVEYVRAGFNMEQCEHNMQTLLSTTGIEIAIHATLTALTIPTLYKLIDKIIVWREQRFIEFGWNTVQSPKCFSPYNFGEHLAEYIDLAEQSFIKKSDKDLTQFQINHDQTHLDILRGIKKQLLSASVNKIEVNNLVGFLNDLDIRRKQDWKSIFPNIIEIVSKINNADV